MSGTGLHLSHTLPWNSMVDLCKTYKHPPIKLPVCESGKIHITNNKVKHQLKNKIYLHDKICHGDCEVKGEKYFRKSYAKKDELFVDRRKVDLRHLYPIFFKKFRETIFQFIETIDPQTTPRTIVADQDYLLHSCDRCNEIIHLIESKNIVKLNSFTVEELKLRFSCRHGGQAVGTHLPFLFYHVLYSYLLTNIIYASGLLENPEKWGKMKPRYRSFLMRPCDGQTFPPSIRQYLKEDVYLKDFGKMKELCKRLFEFIYIYTMLELKIGKDLEIDSYSDNTWIIGI